MPQPIGPRWLSWILLAYGILEIPWVIYLFFFQAHGVAQHIHVAMLGLAGGATVLCLATAWAIWTRSRWTAVIAAMTATWLACTVYFALVISSVNLIWMSIPGIFVAAVAAARALRGQTSPGWMPILLLVVAAVLVHHLVHVLSVGATHITADHLRLLIVVFDSAEVAALLGLGLCLRKGAPRAAIAFGSAGVVLFALDAFINIVTVPAGPAFKAAIFYAVVGELPAIAMCLAGTVLGMRRWAQEATTTPV